MPSAQIAQHDTACLDALKVQSPVLRIPASGEEKNILKRDSSAECARHSALVSVVSECRWKNRRQQVILSFMISMYT